MVSMDGLAVHPYFENAGREPGDCSEKSRHGLPGGETIPRPPSGTRMNVLLQELAQSGYQSFKTEVFTPKITWVHLRKERT